ncbi:peroxisomal trans-2-enoyl-CoA reductase [Elysia marginata]|uniref:Peroxisomal trans-2-enoyl-CoA reductase n=1 Tax=Elysia marginata TaxID=1093978 RepID=A0AAV4FUG3_9GAST|nr:peroxisomal trans-2-enoyl-CoA reductase [Elysia marginata]
MSHTADITLKGWNAVVETNLMGTFLMCREAYNQWMKDNGGVIVNMAMDMWNGFPGMGYVSNDAFDASVILSSLVFLNGCGLFFRRNF